MQLEKLPFRPRLSGNGLKWIAILTMFIDHIGAGIIEPGLLRMGDPAAMAQVLETPAGAAWFQLDFVLRMIGRLAFPIFCFLLVEGFLHTRSVGRYLLRLGLFALLSELPFDLAFSGRLFDFGYQNVFFTLAIGLGVLALLRRARGRRLWQLLAVLAGCALALLLRTDYSALGVLVIVAFYLLRGQGFWRDVMTGLLLVYESRSTCGTAVLALLPIRLYDGTRGNTRLKYLFYWFYPAHLLLFYLLRSFCIAAPPG